MPTPVHELARIERDLIHERFAHFERGVLQDNIILCDAKSGVLLAFAGAMVIFCVDTFVSVRGANASLVHLGASGLFLVSAAAFLVSCHFSLSTVLPRLIRGHTEDHIFWEAPVFRLPVERYVETMEHIDVEKERRDKLSHLHMLAGICRTKFRQFQFAIRCAQAAFVVLVIAELARVFA